MPLDFADVVLDELPDTSEVDERMDYYLKSYHAAGASVLVALGGELVYAHDYGYSYVKGEEPVTENTYFKVASVTKMVSAIRVMQLVEEGKLDLDADISTYLGYTVRNPYAENTPITLRMLMSHTSSLRSEGGYSNEENGLRSLISTDKVQRYNYYKERPGSVYRYSNFGAGIMGSLIECVTGENVEDDIIAHVFKPLGIDAALHAARLASPEDVPWIYTREGKVYNSRERSLTKDWDPDVNPDAHYRITVGSLWIRSRDLMTIAQLLMNGGEVNGVRLLQPETVAEMMSSQQGKGLVTADSPYGLCINRITNLVDGMMFYGHQGMSGDVCCNVIYEPESQFLFVFCNNGINNNMMDHIVKVTRRLFGIAWEVYGP